MLVVILILTVGSALLIFYGISRQRRELRLLPADGFHPLPRRKIADNIRRFTLWDILSRYAAYIFKPLLRLPYFLNLKQQAEVLKINIDLPALFLFKSGAGAIIGSAVFFFVSPSYLLLGLIAGFILPDIYVFNRVKAKKEAIIRIFPEAVDLLDMCINAGADFLSAVRWVIEKSDPNPFIEQLSIVVNEIRMGKTRSEALKDMADRLKIVDISSFVRMIVQSERMGTPIEEAFAALSEDTREKRFRFGERYAIKASLKILFPLLFCILPAILIIVAGPIIIKFSSGELMPKSF